MNSSQISHSHDRRLRPGRLGRRAALVAIAAALSLTPAPALAASSAPSSAKAVLSRAGVPGAAEGLASPYGQVSRFGGFDATGKTPGKFVLPVGFAVDPADPKTADHNAVYVLDRTTYTEAGGEEVLGYRLQKLSSKGEVLGSVNLPQQSFTSLTQAHPVVFLAVDSSAKRVYALVESIISANEEHKLPVAQRLVAWSTEPNAEKKLVPASGLPIDSVTGAGLVAGAAGKSVLEPTEENEAETIGEDLYAPEGLAVNPSNHDVVIEAQRGAPSETIGGPTVLDSVVTEGTKRGQLDGQWLAGGEIAPHTEQGGGIFTASVSSAFSGFGIDLYQRQGAISRLAEVKAEFSKPSAQLLAPDSSGGANRDQAASLDNVYTPNRNSTNEGPAGFSSLELYTAGSPITQLSNGLYAARYAQAAAPGTIDVQSLVAPWEGVPYLWEQGSISSHSVAEEGIRLFTSNGTVIDTVGGQASGQPCNLDFAQLSVAAGANGSLFVLTQPNEENGNSDDEVIEFAPGGSGACPQPAGSLTVNGKSGSSFSFPVGTNVTFADSVERKGEAPYRFDWVLLNAGTLGLEDLHDQIEAPSYTWPAPSTSHTFTKTGTYYVTAAVYGDYGLTYITTDEITIH
jgi:hypothetical protein